MDEPTYSAKAIDILEAAERHMRSGGFDAVSFRDLAAEVGIKSASVHYHFPQKADLGVAVVRRYTERILAALGPPDDPSEARADRLERLCAVYEMAVMNDGLICLCCVLGAESLRLPTSVAEAVETFFTRVLSWTEEALSATSADRITSPLKASPIIASLQGAMILALVTQQPDLFAETKASILAKD
jgi:TetR/AcrR family transcriptional repressor of nem operon